MADPLFKDLAFAALAQTARNPTGDFLQATPRNPILGYLSDLAASSYSPERTQQMQGVAKFMSAPAISETLDRLSYGEPLTTGAGGLGGTTRVRPEALEAAMAVAPTVVPALNMIRPAVKAGARALGPTAVSMGEGYLQRQGLMPQLDVYHGSPYKFDAFDASKIGSGEGAQAYGYGIYTAENPGVSIGYQKALSNRPDASRNLYYNGKEVGGLAKSWKEQDINDFAIRALQDVPSGMGSDQKAIAVAQQVRKVFPDAPLSWEDQVTEAARLIDANKGEILKGNLYKVDLPDEQIAKMLDWDKPLSEQSDAVKAALKGIETKFPEIPDFNLRKWMDTDPLASTFHNVINRDLGVDPSLIANVFKEQGIPGIKYLDEGSRQPGVASMTQAQLDTRINILKKDIDSGFGDQDRMKQILSALEAERASHPKLTRNFVTFPGEEQSMTILERNNQPVQQAMNEFEQSLINFMATPTK